MIRNRLPVLLLAILPALSLASMQLVACGGAGYPSKGSVAPKSGGIDRKVVDKDGLAKLLNDNPTSIARRAKDGQGGQGLATKDGGTTGDDPTGGGPVEAPEPDISGIMKKATDALEKKDFANAQKYANEVIALDPKGYPYAYVVLGDVALEAREYEKAYDYYRKAMELDPKDGWAAQRAAQALLKLKKPIDARALLRKFTTDNPTTDADTYDALAWIELDLGDTKKAEAAFKKALEVSNGKDAEAWYGLALIAARRADPKETERCLTALFELEPERRLVIERDPTFFRMRIHGNVKALFADKKMAEAKVALAAKKKGEPVETNKSPTVAWKIGVPGGAEQTVSEMIRFDFDSAKIRTESGAALDEIATFLKANGKAIDAVEITGHADRRGDEKYNIKLSEQRAQAVRDALVGRGVPVALLKAKGYGMYCPLDDGDDEGAFAKNRRVQFAIGAGGKIVGDELSCSERMRHWLKPEGMGAKLISVKK